MGKLKEQFNLGNIIALAGLLLTAGIGSHLTMTWDGVIGSSVVRQLNDSTGTLQAAIQKNIDNKADSAIINSSTKYAVQEMLKKLADGDRENIVEYYRDNFRFADTMRAALTGVNPKEIKANHNFVKKLIKMRQEFVEFEECAKILRHKETNRPALFIPCEGSPLPIQYGQPRRADGLSYANDVYFITVNGRDIILPLISNVLLIR
jgi:hypothetical protein